MAKSTSRWRMFFLGLHWVIIINFAIEIVYAGHMVFNVLAPSDGGGPLFDRALEIPFEHMVTRRLYALECWLAMAGLSIYLGITEIVPRLRRPVPPSEGRCAPPRRLSRRSP